MDPDEQAIRSLIETWMRATVEGDLPRILELIDDDVVFLGPGRPPMRGKEGFAAASRAFSACSLRRDSTGRRFFAQPTTPLTIVSSPRSSGALTRRASKMDQSS